MVNKKGVWFLTLFSLILVLSVYYITMPTELLISNPSSEEVKPTVSNEESSILVALRVEDDENIEKEKEDLKKIISNAESSIEDKNAAFEKMKTLNANRSKEEILQEKIKSKYKLESFIKIKDENISVTINDSKHDKELANNIMRTIQEDYEQPMEIVINFKTK